MTLLLPSKVQLLVLQSVIHPLHVAVTCRGLLQRAVALCLPAHACGCMWWAWHVSWLHTAVLQCHIGFCLRVLQTHNLRAGLLLFLLGR